MILRQRSAPRQSNRLFHFSITLTAISGMPEIHPGGDIASAIVKAAKESRIEFGVRPLFVVAQKIVSKSEGRIVDLKSVQPSAHASEFANLHGKDPRVVELVLRESARIVRMERGIIIAETRHGMVCANAGVDLSNAPAFDHAILLPEDPDASAQRLRKRLVELTSLECAVIISDSFGRPWRNGLVNVAIGAAGLPVLEDLRGQADRAGRPLQATENATADELAAAAGLLMEKFAGTPAVLVSGFDWTAGNGSAQDLIRNSEEDLFR